MRKLLPFFVLLLVGCQSNSDDLDLAMPALSDESEMDYVITATSQAAPDNPQDNLQQITKKVVKTGSIEFESEDVESDYKRIIQLLPKYKAYVESENQSKTDTRISYQLSIRIPADVYDSLFSGISDLAFRLDNRYTRIEDVTERYYDIENRLKNKKALESRYRNLLSKTSSIKDILEIEKNLNEIRSEIETLQGQFNYLSKQISYSTLNVRFYETLPYAYEPSKREGFGARLLSAFDDGWQVFLSVLLGLTTLWPFALLIIAGVLIGLKLIAQKKKRSLK